MVKRTPYDIEMDCGADFSFTFRLDDESHNPIDLTNASIDARLSEFAESDRYISFAAVHDNTGGHITLILPHYITEDISYSAGVYSVIVEDSAGIREPVLSGSVKINPAVTRFAHNGRLVYMLCLPDETYLPEDGNKDLLYFCTEPAIIYRWNGSAYVSVMRDNTVTIGETTTLEPGEDATVTNSGTADHLILDFGIPAGIPGDIVGPNSSTDKHIVVFDGTTGKVIKDSGYTIGKSVPADAEFTDTKYSASTTSIGSASAGTVISADEITSWDAGSITNVEVDDGVLIITLGSAPSLSHTSKSIPNISVSSETVVTGISEA